MDNYPVKLENFNNAPVNRKRAAPSDEDEVETDISKLSTKIWLVKVPKFLAEKWNSVEESGLDLGYIRRYNGPRSEEHGDMSLVLPDTPLHANIPKQYSLKLTNESVTNTYVFSGGEEGGETALKGTVHVDCVVQPILNDEYMTVMRNRTKEAAKPARTVMLADSQIKPNSIAPGAKAFTVYSARKPTTKQQVVDNKTTRIPRNELMDLLFDGFEKYTYWNFKGIVEFTKQPVAYLKEVLQEICILNKRGPYTSMYELKPEFKRGGESSSGTVKPEPDAVKTEPGNAEEEDSDDEEMEEVL